MLISRNSAEIKILNSIHVEEISATMKILVSKYKIIETEMVQGLEHTLSVLVIED